MAALCNHAYSPDEFCRLADTPHDADHVAHLAAEGPAAGLEPEPAQPLLLVEAHNDEGAQVVLPRPRPSVTVATFQARKLAIPPPTWPVGQAGAPEAGQLQLPGGAGAGMPALKGSRPLKRLWLRRKMAKAAPAQPKPPGRFEQFGKAARVAAAEAALSGFLGGALYQAAWRKCEGHPRAQKAINYASGAVSAACAGAAFLGGVSLLPLLVGGAVSVVTGSVGCYGADLAVDKLRHYEYSRDPGHVAVGACMRAVDHGGAVKPCGKLANALLLDYGSATFRPAWCCGGCLRDFLEEEGPAVADRALVHDPAAAFFKAEMAGFLSLGQCDECSRRTATRLVIPDEREQVWWMCDEHADQFAGTGNVTVFTLEAAGAAGRQGE